MGQLSVEQLAELYPTVDQRDKLLRLHSLTAFLTGCMISHDYRVQDGMHTPIILTKYGERISERLRKAGVPFPESRLLCLLEMLGPEPLIDVGRTEINALQSAIHKQVKSQEIRYPFIFGRILYDKFNATHKDMKYSLPSKDSIEFLHGTPQGVFQVNQYISGPYGLLAGPTMRLIGPTLTARLQHCTDLSCRSVHNVSLETSHDAPINEHRSKITRLMERDGADIDTWFRFFDTFASRYGEAQEGVPEPVVVLIGDALADIELRKLFAWLLDNTAGSLRIVAQDVGLRGGPADEIARSLNRAEMMQLICTVDSPELVAAIDRLVRAGVIVVPEGEVRAAVTNYSKGYGRYGLYAELSRLGVRMQTHSNSIAPLRMQRLVEKMYNLDAEQDRGELLWQLRADANESVDRRLQRHLQMENPREIVEKLVLARRSNVIVASEYLGFADDQLRNDRDLVDTIMWKLGFPVDDFPDINAELFRLHDQIQLLIRQNDSDPHDDFPNELRGECMNYFVKLEEVLQDSVSYATWALTVDHLGSSNPYVYRAAVGGAAAILRLNDASSDDAPEYQVTYNDKPTMYALCRGFERLSVLLSSLREHEKEYLRSQDDYPRWVNGGSLQKFPFVHTVPFLDLAEDAQENILARLRGASRLLVGADVDKIRNGFAHPRVSHAELEFLRASLDSIREAVGQLEADGFCRITYSLERLEGDAMLRRKISLANKKGYKYSLHIPSSYSWLQLPYYGDPQYILQSARLKDSAEVLRFVRRVESSFSEMYDGYPSRPVSSPRARRDELKEEIIDID